MAVEYYNVTKEYVRSVFQEAHVGKDRRCSSRSYFDQIRRDIIVIFHHYVVAFVITGHIYIYIYSKVKNIITLYIYNNRNFWRLSC